MTVNETYCKSQTEMAPGPKTCGRGAYVAVMLRVLLACAFPLFNCADSYNKTPIHITASQSTRPPDAVIQPDAITSSTYVLRFDSGFVGATECTLYLFMQYCNGVIRIRLGEQENNYTVRDFLSQPKYCPDTSWLYNYVSYIFSGLTPKTRYYLNIYGTWGDVTNIPWIMNGTFTTRADSSADTTKPIP